MAAPPPASSVSEVHNLVPDGSPSTHPHPSSDQPSTSRPSNRFQTSDSEFEAKKLHFQAGDVIVPPLDDEKKARVGFSSPLQYILAVIGMSVGLGNIWRFPAVAFQNGGGAFLIPYITMGILFGLPMLYIDSSIGQFMQNSPSIAFRQYFPASQGLGWTMAFIQISIGFFYNLPCCWALIYIVQLIAGRMKYLTSCQNDWNTPYCDSSVFCESMNNDSTANDPLLYFNGTCITAAARNLSLVVANMSLTRPFQSAPEEFFYFHITQKHASLGFGSINWMVAVSLFVCWAITAAGLIKGVQSMGKVALVTTILPYLIITILFFRGVTLKGAGTGIRFFITEPKWEFLLKPGTWIAALTQSCFSLSIGGGAMITMSSYNKRTHPNFRDCIIILCADTFMSFFGGTAVFAILGSMAERLKVDIKDVVSSPLTLTFIAYPEATSHMPAQTLWALLFFLMMFILGISTMFSFVEGFVTCIIDEKPSLGKYRWAIVSAVAGVCFVLNLICFAFQNGYHMFNTLNEFLGTLSLPAALTIETIIIMTYYGAPRLFRDIQCMKGLPSNNFQRIFGNLGLYIKIGVTFTAPLLAMTMAIYLAYELMNLMAHDENIRNRMSDKINGEILHYPKWTVFFGFVVGVLPTFLVPAAAIVNYCRIKKTGEPVADLFRISDDHPSVRYNLPDPVSWSHFFWPPLKSTTLNPSTKHELEDPAVIPTIPSSG